HRRDRRRADHDQRGLQPRCHARRARCAARSPDRGLGLPAIKVPLPYPCPNDMYEARMEEAVERIKAQGGRHVVFGDLFLEDIRAYRDKNLAKAGMTGLYPLWRRDTASLAREMI